MEVKDLCKRAFAVEVAVMDLDGDEAWAVTQAVQQRMMKCGIEPSGSGRRKDELTRAIVEAMEAK